MPESSPFFLSLSSLSSSQVSIHHHAGGHLSSDSFVNVNYYSLSEVVSAPAEQFMQGCPLPSQKKKSRITELQVQGRHASPKFQRARSERKIYLHRSF